MAKYIKRKKWFAWYPVKTQCGKWVWFRMLIKTINDQDSVKWGLEPKIVYTLK